MHVCMNKRMGVFVSMFYSLAQKDVFVDAMNLQVSI